MKKFGCIIAVLLLLFSIQSTLFHLIILKLTPVQWMFFNACVPSSLAYLAGYLIYIIKKDNFIQNILLQMEINIALLIQML